MRRSSLEELDFSELIRPGDTVTWGQACGEALSLTERLMTQRHRIGRFRVLLGTSFSNTVRAEQADVVEFVGFAGTGAAQRLVSAGLLDILPIHMTAVDALIRDGTIRVDVALIQIAEGARPGEYSLGLASDYVRAAISRARLVIAELSSAVPSTICVEPLGAADIDILVETSRAPVEVPPASIEDVERRIGQNVSAYIPDGATLQTGIGAIPDAILASLGGHRQLGIHSAVIGDRVADLVEAGVVTNERKEVDRGTTTTCLLIGTRRLYSFADRNAHVLMAPVRQTHGLATLSALGHFIALNSALEVDLSGQVNAEGVGGRYIGLVGGQVDYMRAAAASDGGRAIVALPATAQGSSRIVARLSGPVTTARSDVDIVVTEHGVAELRGAPLRQRVRRLIEIAAPEERDGLERAAHRMSREGDV